jgi:hypothetical protein
MLEIKATLRVFSTARTLAELTGILGPPDRGFSKGESSGPGGKQGPRTFWSWESRAGRSATFELHLQEVLSFIDAVEGFEQLRQDCEADVFCMLSTTNGQGGANLSHELMARLGARQLSLVLDVYGDSDE